VCFCQEGDLIFGLCDKCSRGVHYPDKIAVVATWSKLENLKELISFLGMAGYYRKFVKHFGIIAKLLIDLLKKHTLFVWTSEHDTTFHTLKSDFILHQF
jgi:hypothetical protein